MNLYNLISYQGDEAHKYLPVPAPGGQYLVCQTPGIAVEVIQSHSGDVLFTLANTRFCCFYQWEEADYMLCYSEYAVPNDALQSNHLTQENKANAESELSRWFLLSHRYLQDPVRPLRGMVIPVLPSIVTNNWCRSLPPIPSLLAATKKELKYSTLAP